MRYRNFPAPPPPPRKSTKAIIAEAIQPLEERIAELEARLDAPQKQIVVNYSIHIDPSCTTVSNIEEMLRAVQRNLQH